MRLWSIHPKYLDSRGLVAVWREGLLAKHCLEGKSRGYNYHPQLQRFKQLPSPIKAINAYLFFILQESIKRGYHFNNGKIQPVSKTKKIKVNSGQINYEFEHLLKKLKKRKPELYNKLIRIKEIELHPLFSLKKGNVEYWERI